MGRQSLRGKIFTAHPCIASTQMKRSKQSCRSSRFGRETPIPSILTTTRPRSSITGRKAIHCRRVVVCCRFVRMHPDGRVVTQSRSGIKVIGGPVSDYHKTRESVRDQIRKEGN